MLLGYLIHEVVIQFRSDRRRFNSETYTREDGETAVNRPGDTKDPWRILGLAPGTPMDEVKSCYRKLAVLFHPDSLVGLDENRRETAARTFILIKDAYREIVDEKTRAG
jgi:DnaJ-class molecular chaperone